MLCYVSLLGTGWYQYPSWLLHWHWGNHEIAPAPLKQPWRIWVKDHISPLTHWGRVTHICVIEISIIGSDNGLSPGRRQAIIWTNAWILLIGHWGTNFSEILISIETFSFKEMHLKMSSAKWRPFCLGLNELSNDNTMTKTHNKTVTMCIFNEMYYMSVNGRKIGSHS